MRIDRRWFDADGGVWCWCRDAGDGLAGGQGRCRFVPGGGCLWRDARQTMGLGRVRSGMLARRVLTF
jgi:hypothetical protein